VERLRDTKILGKEGEISPIVLIGKEVSFACEFSDNHNNFSHWIETLKNLSYGWTPQNQGTKVVRKSRNYMRDQKHKKKT